MKTVYFPNGPIKMAGNLHLPKDFSPDRSYAAIISVHPNGGVKEQTAGLYAARLAGEGMVALAYDASYQGESGGEPRQEENPYARVEDVSAAIDLFDDARVRRSAAHRRPGNLCRRRLRD
jgi:uncharacterized protein